MLQYCQHRGVSEDGKIVCRKIARGDQEVSLALCEACPAAGCNCGQLRFSLEKESESTVVIRYGNGRSEVLEARPEALRFLKAACATLLRPIDTAFDCATCPLRTGGFVQDAIPAAVLEAMPRRAKVLSFPSVSSRS